MKSLFALAACVILVIVAPTLSDAATFRCGEYVVPSGTTMPKVLYVCGPPTWVDYGYGLPPLTTDRLGVSAGSIAYPYSTEIERWFYNRGPSEFMRILTFRNGTLMEVETDGYGF